MERLGGWLAGPSPDQNGGPIGMKLTEGRGCGPIKVVGRSSGTGLSKGSGGSCWPAGPTLYWDRGDE